MSKAFRIALLNPNTNTATTRLMVGITRRALPPEVEVKGFTMLLGPKIVTDEAALEAAAKQIVTVGESLMHEGYDGFLISGFGDPGLAELRDSLSAPVTGIAEAGIAKAAEKGRRFSIITTTIHLKPSIEKMVERYGYSRNLASIRITPGDANHTMAEPSRMAAALVEIARVCVEEDDAEVLLIGGGPLAPVARQVAQEIKLPVVEPVEAGAMLAMDRLEVRSCS